VPGSMAGKRSGVLGGGELTEFGHVAPCRFTASCAPGAYTRAIIEGRRRRQSSELADLSDEGSMLTLPYVSDRVCLAKVALIPPRAAAPDP
jgi:hypothetical protein